jgi:hypothetical protein
MQSQHAKHSRSLEDRLLEAAKHLREEAELLPPGALREQVQRKAARLALLAITPAPSQRLQ